MIIRPAIDIFGGRIVRLRKGEFEELTAYGESPLAAARRLLDAGCEALHLVDLEGAKVGTLMNLETIRSIAALPGLRVEVGGGVRARSELVRLLDLGIERVVLGSVAVSTPALVKAWIDEFGADRFVAAADVRNGMVASKGWLETSELKAEDFIRGMLTIGVRTFLCTDISKDGMLEGPNTRMYGGLLEAFPEARFIASGGVSSLRDLEALASAGLHETVVGKAIYEGRISPEDVGRLQRSFRERGR